MRSDDRHHTILELWGIQCQVAQHLAVAGIDAHVECLGHRFVAKLHVNIVYHVLAFIEHHSIVAEVGAAFHLGVDAGMAYREVVVEIVGALNHVCTSCLTVVECHRTGYAALVGQISVVEGDVETAFRLCDKLRTGDEVCGLSLVVLRGTYQCSVNARSDVQHVVLLVEQLGGFSPYQSHRLVRLD